MRCDHDPDKCEIRSKETERLEINSVAVSKLAVKKRRGALHNERKNKGFFGFVKRRRFGKRLLMPPPAATKCEQESNGKKSASREPERMSARFLRSNALCP